MTDSPHAKSAALRVIHAQAFVQFAQHLRDLANDPRCTREDRGALLRGSAMATGDAKLLLDDASSLLQELGVGEVVA